MSLALPSTVIPDIPDEGIGGTLIIPLTIDAGRISAVRIFNNSPWTLFLASVPGVQSVWLPAWTEEIYRTNLTSNAFYSNTNGQISITPYDFVVYDQKKGDPYTVVITVYEKGDELPTGLPITHNQFVSVINEVKLASCGPFSTTVGAAAAGTLSIHSNDDATGVTYKTVLLGYEIAFDHAAAQHSFTYTITGLENGTLTFQGNIEPSVNYTIFRNLVNGWRSKFAGQASNTITISVPAIVGGPAYTINMWGIAERGI